MDTDSMLLVISIVALILASAFFSATETAFTGLNKIRIKNMASAGNHRAERVLKLTSEYETLLSTVLIGNNIVNILAATLGTVLFTKLIKGGSAVTVSTAVMTVITLFFGEITPKNLAKAFPESYAMAVAPVITALRVLLLPINFLFSQWGRLLAKITKNREDRTITEEELVTIVQEAQNDGEIEAHEGDLIKAAIEFNDVDVGEIITPRVDVEAIEEADTFEEIASAFLENGFSRMPVYRETIDNIIGVIHEKDFFAAMRRGETRLEPLVNEVIYTTRSTKISKLLQIFQRRKIHMAVVVDEYGGTLGIVTLEDVLEELVGEIWDEHDEVLEEIKPMDDGSYIVSSSLDVEELFEMFGIREEIDSASVGGWVIREMGKIPEEGEGFSYKDLIITVIKTEMNRVIEIKVERQKTEGEGEDEKKE